MNLISVYALIEYKIINVKIMLILDKNLTFKHT